MPGTTFTVVYDNDSTDPRLAKGWGFSCLVERGSTRLLFDTGDSGRSLMANLAALHRAPSSIDGIVISHAHRDHTGGLAHLLRARPGANVYVPRGASKRLLAEIGDVGGHAVVVDGKTEIAEGVTITGPLGGPIPEQALLIDTAKGPVLVVGCSHPGIEEMIPRVQEMTGGPLYGVLGGLHLGDAPAKRMARIVAVLRRADVKLIGAGHCTGDRALATLRRELGDRVAPIGSGATITIE